MPVREPEGFMQKAPRTMWPDETADRFRGPEDEENVIELDKKPGRERTKVLMEA